MYILYVRWASSDLWPLGGAHDRGKLPSGMLESRLESILTWSCSVILCCRALAIVGEQCLAGMAIDDSPELFDPESILNWRPWKPLGHIFEVLRFCEWALVPLAEALGISERDVMPASEICPEHRLRCAAEILREPRVSAGGAKGLSMLSHALICFIYISIFKVLRGLVAERSARFGHRLCSWLGPSLEGSLDSMNCVASCPM